MIWLKIGFLLALSLLIGCVQAAPRIAVLNFELKDMTLAPGIPDEIKRTASLKPLLEGELRSAGYEIIEIPASAQQAANSGVGYLFDHADSAAQLGQRYGADYVLVGRLHKPSFLFAYLMGHMARVGDGQWAGQFIVESKGPASELAIKAVETLTVKIDSVLERRYVAPPPAKLKKSR